MRADDINRILGEGLPNAMKAVKDLERMTAPLLAQVNANRDKIDDSLLKQLDASMEQINKAKEELKRNGYTGNK